MIEYLFLAIVKVIDNVVGTAKSIATYKEQMILSSVLTVVSQLLFYLVISQVISDNSFLVILIVSISSGIGNILALYLNNKFKTDTKWTYVLISSNVDDVKKLCKYLYENGIKYVANNGYNKKGEPTINVMAFSKHKHDSRLINKFLEESESRFMKEII